jgi:tyrosyl-tRNA synthetase
MLVGRTLQKKYHNKEKFVIATTLLENHETGKKLMSKSEGCFIALNDTPQDMFGKTMALPDGVVVSVFTDCTRVSLTDIEQMAEKIVTGEINPRDAKLRLAKELVEMYHDTRASLEAEQYFVNTFSKKEIPSKVDEVKVHVGEKFVDVIVEYHLAKSKSDARRKIDQGGVSLDGEKIFSDAVVNKADAGKILKVGKKDFVKLVAKKIKRSRLYA